MKIKEFIEKIEQEAEETGITKNKRKFITVIEEPKEEPRPEPEEETKELLPINIDTIRQLRLSGHYCEAEKLREAYLLNNKKQKKIDEQEIRRRDYLISKHIKTKNNLCMSPCCKNEKVPGKRFCEKHLKYNREYSLKKSKKYAESKKARGICVYGGCNNKTINGKTKCEYHLKVARAHYHKYKGNI